jgi:pSer/pThr/pTyr-binding forkhead associated (FHA) protein
MEVRLKVLLGKNVGQELAVPGPKFFIGRAEDCQLRPRSDLISRHHCVLLIEDSFVAVRDFGSKNGTLINGERIVGERELKQGDRLTVGPLEFEVVIHVPVAAKKRPKVESVKEAAARTAEGHTDKLDISQWLGDGDSKVGNAETRVIHMSETGEIDLDDEPLGKDHLGNGNATATPAKQPSEAVSAKASSTAKAEPGKLPSAAKGSQVDSRSAAADVLKKFFKRR